jgi:tetratricopeptide (TPR) repeat protein
MISRLANWILYAVILAVIGALIYYYTDWFKPAAQKAVVAAKGMLESIPIGPFSKREGADAAALGEARAAYARGDVEGAVRAYADIVKKNADNVDAQGELGNVYYMTGRLREAADAYAAAAKLLIDQRQPERAQALLPAIGQGNPALANEVMQRLMRASQAAAGNPAPQASSPASTAAGPQGARPGPEAAPMAPGQPPMGTGPGPMGPGAMGPGSMNPGPAGQGPMGPVPGAPRQGGAAPGPAGQGS